MTTKPVLTIDGARFDDLLPHNWKPPEAEPSGKDAQTAAKLKATGLHVSGVGGAVSVVMTQIAPLDAYRDSDAFSSGTRATSSSASSPAATRRAPNACAKR